MLAIAVLAVAVPANAGADAIAGATYTGSASDGASVTFTVSPDGALVDSYAIRAIHGTDVNGNGCLLFSAGDVGVWPGAPIGTGAFDWSIGTEFDFKGTFGAGQSASGSFMVDNPAVGASTGCSTGTISWTATTSSPVPPGGGSAPTPPPGTTSTPTSTTPGGSTNPGGSGTSTGTGSHSNKRDWIVTRVSLSKLPRKQIGGRLRSSRSACLARRMVYLWRGRKRIAHTRATKRGTYSFKDSGALRGRAVRATVIAVTTRGVSCASASSSFIGA